MRWMVAWTIAACGEPSAGSEGDAGSSSATVATEESGADGPVDGTADSGGTASCDPVPPGCAKRVFGGVSHHCAIRDDDTLWCWGSNEFGQLGSGAASEEIETVPVQAQGLGPVALASPSSGIDRGFTCAAQLDGRVFCWGVGHDPTTAEPTLTPVEVPGLSNVVSLSGGPGHVCAATGGGEVHCWGSNAVGELGTSEERFSTTPLLVAGIGGAALEVAAGRAYSCVRRDDGAILCWGSSVLGQVGPNASMDFSQPPSLALEGAVQLAVSRAANVGETSCALGSDDAVHCWGRGIEGQLGDGTSASDAQPHVVMNLPPGLAAVGVGGYDVCAATDGGGVYCWGTSEAQPQLATPQPCPIGGLTTELAVGNLGSHARLEGGAVYAFSPSSGSEPRQVELPCE